MDGTLNWITDEREAAIIRKARQRCLDEFAMCRDKVLIDQHGIGIDVQLEYARIVGHVIESLTPEVPA